MSGVEAVRVMAVLSDMLDNLRIISYFDTRKLSYLEHAKEELGSLVRAQIEQNGQLATACPTIIVRDIMRNFEHNAVYESAVHYQDRIVAAKGHIENDDLVKATLDLVRRVKKNETVAERLRMGSSERTDASVQLLQTFAQLQTAAHKKLVTTVEEDNSQREHFEEVKIREEKATSEKQQLQQKLKLERIQRQRQAALIAQEEAAANAQLTAMNTNHVSHMSGLRSEHASTRSAQSSEYSDKKAKYVAMVEAARKELQQVRADNLERELALRKGRKKAHQDAELAIKEYDAELNERDTEHREELAVYTDLTNKMEELKRDMAQMKKEREEYEEVERKKALQLRRQAMDMLRRRRAIRIISESWLKYQAIKKKAKKAEKKAAGKKKK